MIHFNEIAARYGIGMLLSTPTPVLGGLLHTTYRLDAAEGSFAVKILNPAVMKRPEALGNMIRSEHIAAAFRKSLPAVSALEVDGNPVQKIGGEAVMLYLWISGRPAFPPKLSARHAAAVGDLLARMHDAGETLFDPTDEKSDKEDPVDWESLAEEAGSLSPDAPWLPALKAALPDLISRDEDAREAASVLEKTALSHRDLDPKNVLWEGANPHVIDWESAGPVHPVSELLECLLSWSDDGEGGLSRASFDAFLSAYRAKRDLREASWDAVFRAAPLGMLDWLAYNVKRASGIETADEHDRLAGASEVPGTLRLLALNEKNLGLIREWLGV